MKINSIQNIQTNHSAALNNDKNARQNSGGNVTFKGFASAMNFLATNPVWGATAVDITSMGTPRTCIDTCKRGVTAGMETGFREFSSTGNEALIGLYGLFAGTLLSGTLSKRFGVKDPQRIFASDTSIDVYTEKWKAHNGDIDGYINDCIDNFKGYNPNSTKADKKGYVKIPEEYKQDIFNDMKSLTQTGISKKERKIVTQRLNARITEASGAETKVVLEHGNKATTASLNTMTDNFYRLTKAFKENGKAAEVDKFVSKLKTFGKKRAGLGLGLAMAVSAGAQPLNVYMTKKRTGSDGFAGMPGREKDNSSEFKLMKGASAAAMAGLAMASMQAKPTQVLDKILFKGTTPTINQFKALYATTISSRMLSARDKDELRECDTKDILGFLNWLVLGNFVEKGVVSGLQDKKNPLIKYNKEGTKDGFLYKHFGEKVDRFFNSTITSRKEVVTETLKKEGVSSIKPDGKAMNLAEMMKLLPKDSPVRKNLKILNIGQIAGYVYSCAVLGLGIPSLNIAITNSCEKKRNREKLNLIASEKNRNFVSSKSNLDAFTSFKGRLNMTK